MHNCNMGEALLTALSTREETICKVQCMQPSTVQDHAGAGGFSQPHYYIVCMGRLISVARGSI